MTNEFSSIQDGVAALARGEVIIVVDAEDRENEGDFVCAAECATPENINLIMSGRGDFCMPVLPDVCQRLELKPLCETNTTSLGTAFVTPLDHKSVRTGITAIERAKTVQEIINPESKPSDFSRPGHVHLLLAKEGGVLRRSGHTEASVDLAKMAGMFPAAVLCEILAEDGNRASREWMFEIAREKNLQIITISDLIAHRRLSEKLVSRVVEADLPTQYGRFKIVVYDVKYEDQQPIALVLGDITSNENPPLVRMHSSCFTGDLVRSLRCDCGDQLHTALDMIGKEGAGALVYLPQEGRGIGLVEKIKAYNLQDEGMDTVEANHALGHKADSRDYGVGIQILKDLGLRKIRLLTNNPKKTAAITKGFDLEFADQVPLTVPVNEFNERYLATKRDKLGHALPSDG